MTFSATVQHFYTEFFNKKDYLIAILAEMAEKKEKLSPSEDLIFKEAYKISLSTIYPELVFQEKYNSKFNGNYFANVTEQFDLNGTLMLSHLLVHKLFKQKATNVKKFTKKM